MRTLLSWSALAAFATLAAACGGTVSTPPTQTFPAGNFPSPSSQPSASPSSAPTTGSIAFHVTIPASASIVTSARGRVPHPMFTAPAGTTSISFTVTAVNGSTYSGAPTVVTIPNSNCQGTTTLTCAATISAPVGNDVILIKTFGSNGTAPTGEGNVTANVTGGQTTSEPITLGGTIAGLGVSTFVELGVKGTYPVIVVAKDANGNAIIGSYNEPVALADSDSVHTTLSAKSFSTSTNAANVTLAYDGMTLGGNGTATIIASATGIASAQATFPDATYPTVNNATVNVTWVHTLENVSYNGGAPTPIPLPSPRTYTNLTLTGQTLDGVTNLVSQSTFGTNGDPVDPWHAENPLYYAWTAAGDSLSYGYVGYDYSDSSGELKSLCTPPYNKLVILPLPAASWDALAGSGTCTFTLSSTAGPTQDVTTFNAGGSYKDTRTSSGTSSVYQSNADGSAYIMWSQPSGTSYILTIGVPSPQASTIPAQITTFTGPIPSPGSTTTPAPTATTAPNFWTLAGFATGVPPIPLESDTFTPKGSIASLPSQCAVPSSLLGSTPQLSEIDEVLMIADPSDYWYAPYDRTAYNHYYLNGVGEICTTIQQHIVALNDPYGWVTGSNRQYLTLDYGWASYVNGTTIVQAFARTRNFTQALPAAAQALTSANMAFRVSQLQLRHAERGGLMRATMR